MEKTDAKTPNNAAEHNIGNKIFGFAITFAMDILGDPIKCAIQVPTELTFNPATAKPKPAAQIPKLAAPEPILKVQ